MSVPRTVGVGSGNCRLRSTSKGPVISFDFVFMFVEPEKKIMTQSRVLASTLFIFPRFSGFKCFELGWISGQFDLGSKQSPITGPRECQKLCQRTDGCKAFEYRYDLKQCTMKRAFDVRPSGDTYVSGPKHCP